MRLRDDGDSNPPDWLVDGPSSAPVAFVVTLAAGRAGALAEGLAEHRRLAARHGLCVVFEQSCAELPDKREHLGLSADLSQQLVRGFGISADGRDGTAAGEFLLDRPRYDVAVMLACAPCRRAGTFQVVRRLGQDVAGWWAQVDEVRPRGDAALSRAAVAARLVGRWPDATPLGLSFHAPGGEPRNDFDFDADPHGHATPRFAHIRKMYPRGGIFVEREWHRIIRRAVPSEPYEPAAAHAERGLLFNAYLASIEGQFGFPQQSWANGSDFFEAGDGQDPIVGSAAAPATLRRLGRPPLRLSLARCVRTTGAVYAFVPRIGALRALAGEP